MEIKMSFEELTKKLSSKLIGISYKVQRYPAFFDRSDLYQEALMQLWINFKQGKLSDKTESYILQGCYFHLKNYMRKTQDRIMPLSLSQGQEEGGAAFEETFLLKDHLQQDCRDFLSNKLLAETIYHNGLTKREKELLPFFMRGLTTREIGEKIGISHVRVIKLKRMIAKKCLKYLDIF